MEEDIQQTVKIIESFVPKESKKEINTKHNYYWSSLRKKKMLSRRKDNFKKKTLTRKEYAELGLFALARKGLKYTDLLPLNQLWMEYMANHLDLHKSAVPTVDDPKYEHFSNLLIKADFNGAKLLVSRSKCPSLVGHSGIVLMDTKQTFKIIEEDNKVRTIPKNDCVFKVLLNNLEFTLFGKHLNIRPAERSVKKIKAFMDPDLN